MKNYKYLLLFQLIDIIAGLLLHYINHDLSSSEFRKGLYKKLVTWLSIAACMVASSWLEFDLTSIALNAFIAYEFLSIIENIEGLGVHMGFIPKEVKDKLHTYQGSCEDPKDLPGDSSDQLS